MSVEQQSSWPKRIIVVVAALFLLWLSVTEGLAWKVGFSNPGIALRLSAENARANTGRASVELYGTEDPDLEQASKYAGAALSRDLTQVSAVRNLGIILDRRNDTQGARTIMQHALKLSRRNLGTHIWLIEDAAKRNDLSKVLDQYDQALRTSRSSWAILPESLSQALIAPDVRVALAERIKRKPQWAGHVVNHIATQTPHLSEAADLFGNLIEYGYIPSENAASALIGRLGDRKDFADGFALYQQYLEADTNPLNGNFQTADKYTPFDWSLEQGASLIDLTDDNVGLEIRGSRTIPKVSASRIYQLQPAQYTLISDVEAADREDRGALQISLSCTGKEDKLVYESLSVGETKTQSIRRSFTVPTGCPTQMLELSASNDGGVGKRAEIVVARMDLQRANSGSLRSSVQ